MHLTIYFSQTIVKNWLLFISGVLYAFNYFHPQETAHFMSLLTERNKRCAQPFFIVSSILYTKLFLSPFFFFYLPHSFYTNVNFRAPLYRTTLPLETHTCVIKWFLRPRFPFLFPVCENREYTACKKKKINTFSAHYILWKYFQNDINFRIRILSPRHFFSVIFLNDFLFYSFAF